MDLPRVARSGASRHGGSRVRPRSNPGSTSLARCMTLCRSQEMGLIIVPPSRPSSAGEISVRLWWGRPRSTPWNYHTHSRPGGHTGKGELSGFSPRNIIIIIIPESQHRLHLLQEVFLDSLCRPSDLLGFPALARGPSVSLRRWYGMMHSLLGPPEGAPSRSVTEDRA